MHTICDTLILDNGRTIFSRLSRVGPSILEPPSSQLYAKGVSMSEALQLITNLISTLGFPIVAYFVLFKFMRDELAELKDVVASNTSAINSLLQHLK